MCVQVCQEAKTVKSDKNFDDKNSPKLSKDVFMILVHTISL